MILLYLFMSYILYWKSVVLQIPVVCFDQEVLSGTAFISAIIDHTSVSAYTHTHTHTHAYLLTIAAGVGWGVGGFLHTRKVGGGGILHMSKVGRDSSYDPRTCMG